jgi:hypothetical protein
LLCLLFYLRHFGVKQDICRKAKSVDYIGKDFDRRIDPSLFYILNMSKSSAGLLGKLLLRQVFFIPSAADDCPYML